ncbi:MAG: hypothetical protein IJ723_01925 [Ruminococcus sp.]|nr:hypothetical protein [Ruminococcus sp.]
MSTEELSDLRGLVDMYLEDISEEIDRTNRSIAELEGKVSVMHIEYGRIKELKKRIDGGDTNA